jgi:hypothetical protein
MINFVLHNFVAAHDSLRELLNDFSGKAASPQEIVSSVDHRRVAAVIDVVAEQCVQVLQLHDAWDTIQELFYILGNHHVQPYTWGQLYALLETLARQINNNLQAERFFHYPLEMARLAAAIEDDWKDVLAGFPSARQEIIAAVDCFALADYPGCVFHMVRIAEKGLRLMACERGITKTIGKKPVEYAMLGEVISSIQRRIEDIVLAKGNKTPLTPKRRTNREKAVDFYRTILSDMQALQTLRDRTMHLRDTYDRGQAYTAMTRVKEMMTIMAPRLNEAMTAKIKWGL